MPVRMWGTTALAVVAAAGVTTAVVAVAAPSPSAAPTRQVRAAAPVTAVTGGTLDQEIARTQQHLRTVPGDWQSWAGLGFDYVSQARLTVDPTYYPKADAALAHSLRLNRKDNFVAMAGEAALASARHEFRSALAWAHRGLRIDPRSAVLHGALTDALTQLGRYRAAARTAREMELLRPGSDAEARLSYAAELAGHLRTARMMMRQSLAHSAAPADVAFARYYLGELARTSGHPAAALREYAAGFAADRTYAPLLEGRAKAEAALGHTVAAVHDFATVVDRVPQPTYVLEYGELLQSLGRQAAAARQYSLFRVEERLFRANGVTLDSDAALFEADHGDAEQALAAGRSAIRTRPFLDSYDAYGWALHRVGRDGAALRAVDRALRTGDKSALYRYHRGVIEAALGQRAQAAHDLRAALRIDPAFSQLQAPAARQLLARLAGPR